MADFSATIEAKLAGRVVNFAPLVLFDFRDGEFGAWCGQYPLLIGGHTYQAFGQFGSVTGLDKAATLDSSAMTFTLSGVDSEMLGIAVSADRANYVNRLATVYMQWFDEDWQPLDEPYALKAGLMDDMQISRAQTGSATGGVVWTRSIVVTAQNIFFGRGVAPFSLWTDRDQQKRYPGQGDKGLQYIPALQNEDIPQPWH